MDIDIDKMYQDLKYRPKINDIVYRAKCYKSDSKTLKQTSFELYQDKFIVIDLEVIYDFWVNYKLQNLRTNQIIIQQTSFTLYRCDLLDDIIKKYNFNNKRIFTIFDFM